LGYQIPQLKNLARNKTAFQISEKRVDFNKWFLNFSIKVALYLTLHKNQFSMKIWLDAYMINVLE